MTRGAWTWLALALAGAGAGWSWSRKLAAAAPPPSGLCELHADGVAHVHEAEAAPAVRFVESPEDLDPRLLEMSRRAMAYTPGAGDAFELEEFWRSCAPVPLDDLEPLLGELEQRVEALERMAARHAREAPDRTASDDGLGNADLFAEYCAVGLAEARFLVDECIAGRLRVAPFVPLPETVRESSHASVQLVAHHANSGFEGYVGRLEEDLQPRLFRDRSRVYSRASELAAAPAPPSPGSPSGADADDS